MAVLEELTTGVVRVVRPLALVAEDNPILREQTLRVLDRRGITAVAVGSYSQASTTLTHDSGFDVALLDIHLDHDKDSDDKGGIDIARLIKTSFPETEIIGYSGKFASRELSPDERELFTATRTKGRLTQKDHQELWDLTELYARQRHEERRARAFDTLTQLRRLYENEVSEKAILTRKPAGESESRRSYTAEGALGVAGFRLTVTRLRLGRTKRSRELVVWEQNVVEDRKRWVNLEIYGVPELYASGRRFDYAVAALSDLVGAVQQDATERPQDSDHALIEFFERLAE